MTITCKQCGHNNPDDAEFCEQCGAQLPVAVASAAVGASSAPAPMPVSSGPVEAPSGSNLLCPSCRAPLAPGDEFCFNCGTDVRNLTSGTPAPTPVSNNGAATPAPDQNGMKDEDIDKALAELGNAPASATAAPTATPAPDPATPPVSAVGPEAQPAVVPPQTPPAPPVGASSGGSMPMPPGPSGGIAGNAFGAPSAPPATSAAPASGGFGTMPVTTPPAPTATPAQSVNALKLHVNGPYGDELVEWKGRELLLGRSDAKTRVFPEVNLDDSAASRRHVSVWKEDTDGLFYVQDLESANGTSLNGNDLKPGEPTQLNNGDVLKIGTRYSIQVKIN